MELETALENSMFCGRNDGIEVVEVLVVLKEELAASRIIHTSKFKNAHRLALG